jgi:hypothetical protein
MWRDGLSGEGILLEPCVRSAREQGDSKALVRWCTKTGGITGASPSFPSNPVHSSSISHVHIFKFALRTPFK